MARTEGASKGKGLACVVLAAGQGTRMKSGSPKVLHEIGGRPMLHHVLGVCEALEPARIVTVVGKGAERVGASATGFSGACAVAVQDPPLGTAHAVLAAEAALKGHEGDVLILYGDTPFIRVETLRAMLAARGAGAAVVVLGFRPEDPGAYGRLILGDAGALEAIVEAKDAGPEQLSVGLCNGGVMAVDGAALFELLHEVGNDNANGEYYLTEIVRLARARGLACAVVEGEEEELLGINSRSELAHAEAVFQARGRAALMEAGVTLLDPSTVYLSWDTEVGPDTVIGQNVVFGPGAHVEAGVTIRPFCHIEGARIASGAVVGPFARVRPGSEIGRGAHIGNFVETKKAKVGEGAKINHLSYMGDVTIGPYANVGAGAITCNYDGFDKFETRIGENAFVGTNSSLVAPVVLGDRAFTAAGSVITGDVPADALGVARGQQRNIEGWAERFRSRKLADRALRKKI